MDGVELLRSKNRFDETLPSGLNVTLRRPRIRDCIIAGAVPVPVLDHLLTQIGSRDPDVSNEDAAHMARFQDEIVRRSIVAIEGEPVELSLEDVTEVQQKDYDRIVAIAMRQDVSPKAADLTSVLSQNSPPPTPAEPSPESKNGSGEIPQPASSPSTTS